MPVSLPAHGAVPFEADGRTWQLRFSVNAMCRLERAAADWADDPAAEVNLLLSGQADAAPKVQTLRAAVWAGLLDHHPDLSSEDAGRLVDHLGVTQMGGLIAQAIVLAYPPADAAANPRKAPRAKAGRA